jgi:hypothetical protein
MDCVAVHMLFPTTPLSIRTRKMMEECYTRPLSRAKVLGSLLHITPFHAPRQTSEASTYLQSNEI